LKVATSAANSPERRAEIDGLRALAVLSVALGHACKLVAGPIAVFVAHAGTRGVDLFFVLSGFCLSYPLLQNLREHGRPLPRIAAFLRRRIARIAPPYYAALLLFGALSFTRFGMPEWPGLHLSTPHLLHELGLDALFLTNAGPIPNPDFWTLSIEMRWYIFLPLILALYVRSRVLFAALGLALYADYASPYAIADAGTMPCFMLGIVAADLALRRYTWTEHFWPAALAMLALAGWWQRSTPDVDQGNWLWHVTSFAVVLAVVGNAFLRRAFSARALVAVGVASYSIYLVHHPLIEAFAYAGFPVPLAFALAIVCGFAFWRLVEEPFLRPRVRRAVEDALAFRWIARAFRKGEPTALPRAADSPAIRS
jgi:peptidoglycan/LPS O-acetylase OafA/YrhL